MKISYHWLQKYFSDPLPPPEKLAEIFTFHSSEVEGIEKRGDDTILDIKVLPDRAHYLLSHQGAASELVSITGAEKKDKKFAEVSVTGDELVSVKNEEPALCLRYVSRSVENITIKSSSVDIASALEAIGSRSINNIVDATNFVMFDIGQPLHAFDADKVVGSIIIRKAQDGEKITILDGREIVLDISMLVIADEAGALAIAGVKGGKRAEITDATTKIIIESANFDAASVRRTSTKTGIRNDSSKRFENRISPYVATNAMHEISALIAGMQPNAKFGPISDIREDLPKEKMLAIPKDFISTMLGTDVPEKEIISILKRIGIEALVTDAGYQLTISPFHVDINSPEDVVEEIGRIYGYEKIPSTLPSKVSGHVAINKTYYWNEKIKDTLTAQGFSEVFTYSLTDKAAAGKDGIEIQNPLASDKNFLRMSLAEGIEKSLALNIRNADLLNLPQIKIFEIGTVFNTTGEHLALALGVLNVKGRGAKKETEAGKEVMKALQEMLGLDISVSGKLVKNVFEVNLSEIIEKLPEPKTFDLEKSVKETIKYKPISPYPFIVRDIAVFVPTDVVKEDIEKIINDLSGSLRVRTDLFDVFTKKFENGEEKTSYAFRIVFQSHERTLVEDEVNVIMQKITEAMNAHPDWQVR